MRLALVGTGRMGTAVEALAGARGHEIVAGFNSEHPLPDDADALEGADAVIDFSLPTLAPKHIERYCLWRTPAVVGTTGWMHRVDEVRGWVERNDATLLYAPNFSIGVALLVRSLRAIMPYLDRLQEFDPYVHEVHHVNKVDSPSGTALLLGNLILDGLDRKQHIESETQHQRIDDAALHVSSTRAGSVIGKHTVTVDSPFDVLTFEHEAKNREGFAFGALKAAEWLQGRRGLFTLDDVLNEWMEG